MIHSPDRPRNTAAPATSAPSTSTPDLAAPALAGPPDPPPPGDRLLEWVKTLGPLAFAARALWQLVQFAADWFG